MKGSRNHARADLRPVLCIACTMAVALSPSRAAALEHPPLLEGQSGCEDWQGTASGNDPSVRLHLQLCAAEAGRVRGRVQWSSLESGWNVREVEGRWTASRLQLSDVRLSESHPNPGWRFCVIDRWRLERQGDRLQGEYVSEACRDRARVHLERVAAGRPSPSVPPNADSSSRSGGIRPRNESEPSETVSTGPPAQESMVPDFASCGVAASIPRGLGVPALVLVLSFLIRPTRGRRYRSIG